MQRNRRRGLYENGKISYIPISEITLSTNQPRIKADGASMEELTMSVTRYGILQPLSVRARGDGGYELIAGERRLRAALAAGLSEVPCIVMKVTEPESAVIALVENLQRKDLDFIDEAKSIVRLMSMYGLSQEETAKYIGRSQPAVANKLRILRLPPEVLHTIRESSLSERHARALLRLKNDEDVKNVLSRIIRDRLSVADTDKLVDDVLEKRVKKPSYIIKDIRLFLNSLERSVQMMNNAGINTKIKKEETEDGMIITVFLKKTEKDTADV